MVEYLKKYKWLFLFFIKLKKKEKIYIIIELINFLLIAVTIYIFMYFIELNPVLFTVRNTYESGKDQLLQITEKGLIVLAIICMFITAYSSIVMQIFQYSREKKRYAILKVIGMKKEDKLVFKMIDNFFICISVSIVGLLISRYTFLHLVNFILEINLNELNIQINELYSFFKVFSLLYSLMCICYGIGFEMENNTSITKILRRGDDNNRINIALYGFFFGIYILIICMVFIEPQFIIVGSLVLLFMVLFIYYIMIYGLTAVEKGIKNYFIKKSSIKRSISFLSIQMLENRKKKNAFIITIISFCILLIYLIFSIEWGIEGILESYWKKTQNMNTGIISDNDLEKDVEIELNHYNIHYNKIYMKTFNYEDSGYSLAVSTVKDKESAFYVEPEAIRTIMYNMHNWGMEVGNIYEFHNIPLEIGEPIPEYILNLVSYQVLINFEDWESQIDESYITIFIMLADSKEKGMLLDIADKYKLELINSETFSKIVKEVFSGYIRLLWFVLIILMFLITFFCFSSILTSIISRDKEFYIYWGCGASKSQITHLIMFEYLYISIIGVLLSTTIFIVIINLIQKILFQEMELYRLPFFILFIVTIIFILVILSIVSVIIKYFSKLDSYEMLRKIK